MNPKQDNLFNTSLITILAIFVVLNQAALITGGGLGIPYFELPIKPRKSAEVSKFTVEFIELDDDTFESGLPLESYLEQLELETAPSIKRLANRLGIAYFEDDAATVATLRTEFEEAVLVEVDSAEYNIVLRVIHPDKKYNEASSKTKQILTTLQYGQAIAQR